MVQPGLVAQHAEDEGLHQMPVRRGKRSPRTFPVHEGFRKGAAFMPAHQAGQGCLAGGGGIVLHRGTLHAERSSFNLQKQAAEKGRFSGVVPAFACLFWGFPLPFCKWPGAFPTGLSLFPPDCAFPPGRCYHTNSIKFVFHTE